MAMPGCIFHLTKEKELGKENEENKGKSYF